MLMQGMYSACIRLRSINQHSCLSYELLFSSSLRACLTPVVYEDLHRNLVDQHAWIHTKPYLRGRPDSLNAPYFGYTVERMWSVLLQCSHVDSTLKCPTPLAG
jgi:hypothetical protein